MGGNISTDSLVHDTSVHRDQTVYSFYLGIDPGWSGGISVLSSDGLLVYPYKMPKSPGEVSDLFEDIREKYSGKGILAVLEKVSSRPGQSSVATFTFGRNVGIIEGILLAHKIPYEFVSPQTWQKNMGCMSGGDKNITKDAAKRLFPGIKVTHAIADAILISEYSRRKYLTGK